MKELEKGLLYLSLHRALINKWGVNAEIRIKVFYHKVGEHFLVPKNLRPVILREMEEKNLLSRPNCRVIKILPSKVDLEKEANKISHFKGVF